ncbi:MAG TPA: low molecular weight protein arginine phosphatase [Verrucomicrobia bacterium]|nr:low molecular weight protein arginine phosphatase [Verrucomicrobiota bacterium]
MKRTIVFVCTGNICRSPMAEYLFRAHIASQSDIRVCSAGVMTGYGQPASRYAVKAMNELGVDMNAHRSQPVTQELVDAAELLVVMTEGHRDVLLSRYPQAASRVALLKSFDTQARDVDVLDPIGLSLDVYRHVRDEIAAALWGLDLQLQENKPEEEK